MEANFNNSVPEEILSPKKGFLRRLGERVVYSTVPPVVAKPFGTGDYHFQANAPQGQGGHILTSREFPTPQIAERNDLKGAAVNWFAEDQANDANIARAELEAMLAYTPEAAWPGLFESLNKRFVEWRHQLAIDRGTASSGAAAPLTDERFVTPITDTSPNVDPVGDVGFWNDGYAWDEALGRYAGGEETPASRQVVKAGEWLNERMDNEQDDEVTEGVLQNRVVLPSGRVVNGNLLLRGEGAHEQNVIGVLRAKDKGKGVKTSWIAINGDIAYTQTGTKADRNIIRQELYAYAAKIEAEYQKGNAPTVEQWAEIAYLLYQSPEMKKGSDAVNRVFLMTLASRWFESLPTMPQDVDWRAYIRGQEQFIEDVLAEQSS